MPENKTFELALFELQEIINKLESSSISLEEMIKLYESGMVLMDYCSKELNNVEERVKILVKENDKIKLKTGKKLL